MSIKTNSILWDRETEWFIYDHEKEEIMKHHSAHLCPLCGGEKKEGTMTFTADLKETLIVVRDVLSTIYSLCGHEWLSDRIACELETIVKETQSQHRLFEVHQFSENTKVKN